LLAAADVDLAVVADFADVAGVKPAVLERARGLLRRVEVALRHVLATDQNLAVGSDFHLHAADRLADRSLFRVERMIERDDRCSFGEPVSLDHDESEFAPERFEVRVEWSGADDERPELQAEGARNRAMAPPAFREMLAARLKPMPVVVLKTSRLGLR